MPYNGHIVQAFGSVSVVTGEHPLCANPTRQKPHPPGRQFTATFAQRPIHATCEPIPDMQQVLARLFQHIDDGVIGENTRTMAKLAEPRQIADHAPETLNTGIGKRVNLVPVHELESLPSDLLHEGPGRLGEERMRQILCVTQLDHLLIVIARDVHRIHIGQTVQERLAPRDDAVERISQQLKEIADDDQPPFLLLDVPEKGIEE
jgi:hypothetical protein